MISKIFSAVTLVGFNAKSCNAAVATFSNNGISGTVTASDGTVTVDLDISNLDIEEIGGYDVLPVVLVIIFMKNGHTMTTMTS